MSQDNPTEGPLARLPEAVIAARSRISVIWFIPLVAVAIGFWLVYQNYAARGPEIIIEFKTAEGLAAGKTKVKLKDVEAGTVEDVRVTTDLQHVEARARMEPWAEKHLTAGTHFWIERPRITAGRVSGLQTLMSGAYVGMDPGQGGEPERHFIGLEMPPLVTGTELGRHFVLRSPGLGSLNIGSPVIYRQIDVGRVVGFNLDPARDYVDIRLFIAEPYDQLVRKHSRFWNASGVDFKLSADGVKVDMDSLVSVLIGGVAFDNPATAESREPAEEEQVFPLYGNQEATRQVAYATKDQYLLYFDGSVRGLSAGAPVELRGFKVGEVVDVRLQLLADDLSVRARVLIEVQPERVEVVGAEAKLTSANRQSGIEKMVERGLRAQLKTGSLLTGQLFVDFDFHPEAREATIGEENGARVLPTIPSSLETIASNLTRLLGKLEAVPVEQIGTDLRDAIRTLKEILGSAEVRQAIASFTGMMREGERAGQRFNSEIVPALGTAVQHTHKALDNLSALVTPASPLYTDVQRLLRELTDAARSIRVMADYLERHPEALITGKGGKR